MKKAIALAILALSTAGPGFGAQGTGNDSAGGDATNSGSLSQAQIDANAKAYAKLRADREDAAEKKRLDDLNKLIEERRKTLTDAEEKGVQVRIGDIARFKGVRSNSLLGIGLVVGLEGTGDSTKIPFTLQMMANMLKASGITIDSSTLNPKNVAAVTVTAELPPFASPGNKVDVQVSSYGDAKSLQGGILLQTPLYGGGSNDKAYVFAQGPVSIGGFQAGANGSSVQRNALCAGKVPDGGTVENEVPTTTVFDGKMYLELDDEDFTTAKRIAATIEEEHPEFAPVAMTAGKIQLVLPSGMPPVTAMAIIEQTEVYANIPAVVVINERTGTIVVGGNVRLGPAIVIKGGLNVRIETLNAVSQPLPFSNTGQTEKTSNSRVSAREDSSQMAVVIPNTTVADLARIFQELRVSATDMISILEELRAQGALKARIKQQ